MKRYLLALCGMSPQVITETLYALHMDGRMVDGIRILTTRQGKREISATLLSPEDGQYYRFCKDYDIDPSIIDFQPRHVIAVKGEHGTELDDISSGEDSEAFLRLCMETTFELTGLPETAVCFSLAGGRKTMGASLAIAAQCYARPQDRLCHVLVSPEFESNRNFFYPPPESRLIELKDQSSGEPFHKETKYAKITLVPMPFISVRGSLTDAMLKSPESPQSLMLSLVRDPLPELEINLPECKLVWKGREMDMRPSWLALYAFFAMVRKEADCSGRSCKGCDACHKTYGDIDDCKGRVSELYALTGKGRLKAEMSDSGIQGLTAENFRVYRTKINTGIQKVFGVHESEQLQIKASGRKPNTSYGIALDRERIRVVM